MAEIPAFLRLHDAIRSADRVLLMTHRGPDGDAVGSVTALLGWLHREGKDVTAFAIDGPDAAYRFVDHAHRFTDDPTAFDAKHDLVVILDASEPSRCMAAEHIGRLPPDVMTAIVDHHPAPNRRDGPLDIVDTSASSTCELVHRFFETNGIRIDQAMATSLLLGILTDTGNFSNAATTPSAIRAASNLLASGARNADIVRHVLRDKTVDGLKVWGVMLARLHHDATYGIAVTYLLASDIPEDRHRDLATVVSGFSNYLNAVAGDVGTVLVLEERPDGKVKGSFRSVDRDVAAIARRLGGGGHVQAAGFTVDGRITVTPDGPKIVAAKRKNPASQVGREAR